MRLSDAIATGRTLVTNCVAGGSTREKAEPGDGCVLDMAALAVGKCNWQWAKEIWPWLRNLSLSTGCDYESEIYTRFDQDVMARGTLTLDQLIDYVRSVEPAEPVESTPIQPAEQHMEQAR